MASFDVPVLLVAFNRPHRLSALLDRLRAVAPARVYLAVDGPRRDVAGEAELVAETRGLATAIDWTSDVRTLFRDDNQGCGRGVSGAIDWFFTSEERGIVLEDDLLPEPSFFSFCQELLERYEDDRRVWAVSGCNFVPPEHIGGAASYRFASYPHVWGWATWRRAWQLYRYDLRGWRTGSSLHQVWRGSGSPWAFAYWLSLFELTARGSVDTWDYQAVLASFRCGGLTATSNTNLVTNLGFGVEATHTADRPAHVRAAEELRWPLVHPAEVQVDLRSEAWTRRQVLGATPRGLMRQGLRAAGRRGGA
jgi:hypothetical protein